MRFKLPSVHKLDFFSKKIMNPSTATPHLFYSIVLQELQYICRQTPLNDSIQEFLNPGYMILRRLDCINHKCQVGYCANDKTFRFQQHANLV